MHGEGTGKDGGFVAAIEADIRLTAPVFTELRAADGETDRRMAAVLDASGRLVAGLATLQSVEEDIRITGLNATFRCGRLGPVGRPLAAVAQELRACSSRFGGDSAAVLGDLDRLKSIAAGLRDPAREARHVALAEATSGIVAALEHLSHLEHELYSALAQLQADADEVGRLAENAVSQFSVRHALAATLRQVAAAFESANTGTGPETVEIPRGRTGPPRPDRRRIYHGPGARGARRAGTSGPAAPRCRNARCGNARHCINGVRRHPVLSDAWRR